MSTIPPPGPWQTTTVVGITPETATAKTLRLRLDRPAQHVPGQHYVIRLTAPDGYTAARSYSAASIADGTTDIDFTVERLDDGEVSTFLHDELLVGDALEIRGPIGGWFVWQGETPALLVGGGSGIVPLMAMLRWARHNSLTEMVRLVVSVRTEADLYYATELPAPETTIVYTRRGPRSAPRPPGRLTRDDLAELVHPDATVYVCGSSGFADAVTSQLVELGTSTDRIRVERFGPSG